MVSLMPRLRSRRNDRAAGFVIRRLEGERSQPFLVDIRRVGLVRRKTFTTLEAARAYCFEVRAELDGSGMRAFELNDEQRLQAVRAIEMLSDRCTLEDAARFWNLHHPDQRATTFADVLARYREHLLAQRVRRTTMQGLWRLDRFGREFAERALSSIRAEEIAQWLDGREFSASNRNNYRRRLSAFFAYGVEKGILEQNPVSRVPVIRTDPAPVVFWTADQVATLLRTADALYPKLVPMLAIMAFGGLRPFEAEALSWDSINLTERIIRIEGSVSKTRSRRIVPIQENLVLWLTRHRKNAGLVAPKPQSLRRWRQRIAAAAVLGDVAERIARRRGLKGTAIRDAGNLAWRDIVLEAQKARSPLWPPDILRHTYATHWLAAYKDENALAQAMGNSPGVIHRYYRGLVTQAEAMRYWEIRPAGNRVLRLPKAG